MEIIETDSLLGYNVGRRLKDLGIETPRDAGPGTWSLKAIDMEDLRGLVECLLRAFALDIGDSSLRDTPDRVARMWVNEVFRGLDYNNFPKCTTIPNEMHADEIILSKGVSVWSMCEHHLIPFTGLASVGYIPATKIIGLSKFNRVVDFFSRRPQVQERLTEQIYAALSFILGTPDVAVVLECTHHCVRLRGVKDVNSSTVTSKMGGRFLTKPEARAEFLELSRR